MTGIGSFGTIYPELSEEGNMKKRNYIINDDYTLARLEP